MALSLGDGLPRPAFLRWGACVWRRRVTYVSPGCWGEGALCWFLGGYWLHPQCWSLLSICRSPAQLNCSSGLPFMCLVIWSLLVCWKLRKTRQLTWCHFRRATDFWMSVAPSTNLLAQWSPPNLCSASSSCCGGPSSMLWLSHQGLNKVETENSYGRTLKVHENTKLHILPLFDMSCHLV